MSIPTGARMLLVDGLGPATLTGGSSSDLLITEDDSGGDVFSGAEGQDFIDYTHAPAGITVTLNNKPDDGAACPGTGCEGDNVMGDIESIAGTPFNDSLTGNGLRNLFDPSVGVNTVFGKGGDDVFFEGGGKDDFTGGKGFDLASYQRDDLGVDVRLDGLPNDGPPGDHDNIREDVEGVEGGTGGDHLTGNVKPNLLRGGFGDDTVNGGGGNDVLVDGTSAAVPGGSDVLIGGTGVDTADYQNSLANLTLSLDGKRNDTDVGDTSVGIDNIHADVENVLGGRGNDRITGNAKPNRLAGGIGDDVLIGLGGNDVLLPGAGEDDVKGGPGLDVASFLDAAAAVTADLLAGSASGDGPDSLGGVERLIGSLFGDHLIGSLGANRIEGRGGNDVLKGLAGNDVLLGGAANDNLDGGPDSDTCKQGDGSGPVTHCEH
jgi:Ca2+-binding RTX toxin-like protein